MPLTILFILHDNNIAAHLQKSMMQAKNSTVHLENGKDYSEHNKNVGQCHQNMKRLFVKLNISPARETNGMERPSLEVSRWEEQSQEIPSLHVMNLRGNLLSN